MCGDEYDTPAFGIRVHEIDCTTDHNNDKSASRVAGNIGAVLFQVFTRKRVHKIKVG